MITADNITRIIVDTSFAREKDALYKRLKIIKGSTKIIADLIVRLMAKRFTTTILGTKLPSEIIIAISVTRITGIFRNM